MTFTAFVFVLLQVLSCALLSFSAQSSSRSCNGPLERAHEHVHPPCQLFVGWIGSNVLLGELVLQSPLSESR